MDHGIDLTEIDRWDLQDIHNMFCVVEMKTAYTEAHSKFMEDKNTKAAEQKIKK